jgi:putative FmdB family regulatory protein
MPTYEYVCTDCGRHLEAAQSFSDPALTVCPQCGGPLRKVFGSVGFVLKGSGFYKTDNRRTSDSKGSRDSESTSDTRSSKDSSSEGSSSNGSKTDKADKTASGNGSGSTSSGTSEKSKTAAS